MNFQWTFLTLIEAVISIIIHTHSCSFMRYVASGCFLSADDAERLGLRGRAAHMLIKWTLKYSSVCMSAKSSLKLDYIPRKYNVKHGSPLERWKCDFGNVISWLFCNYRPNLNFNSKSVPMSLPPSQWTLGTLQLASISKRHFSGLARL